MRYLLLIFSILLSVSGFSQFFGDLGIEDSKITPWTSDAIEDYEGVYYFGISEAESRVTLAIEGNTIDFQIENNGKEIYNNGNFAGWERNIENYTNVSIKENKFFSDQTNGEFVYYQIGNNKVKGLKMDKPPIDLYEGKYEIGEMCRKDKYSYFDGNYVRTKFEILSSEELQKLDLLHLKIMRNEIFARYSYKFKEGGEMEKYFMKQTWYSPDKSDVNSRLTEIEKENIKNIRIIEKEKTHNKS